MEASKSGKGGKRLGAGRKPIGHDKKVQISLYVPEKEIWPFGNEEKLKSELYSFISGRLIPSASVQDLTKSTIEIKPFEQPKSNFQVNIPEKQALSVKPPKTAAQWIKEKRDCENEEQYQQWLADLEADPYLGKKQKDLIKSTNPSTL